MKTPEDIGLLRYEMQVEMSHVTLLRHRHEGFFFNGLYMFFQSHVVGSAPATAT